MHPLTHLLVRCRRRWSRLALLLALALPALAILQPPPRPLFPPDYSAVVLDEHGEVLRLFLNQREHWCLPPQDSLALPPKLKAAVLLFEDRYFYRHPGVNPAALLRAAIQNVRQGRIASGASTITMQVVRLANPKPRTFANKLREILLALRLELYHSKEEILRLYLDHAPYGGNIAGYQAASLRYFSKLPAALSWSEAATLAVLPNAPGLVSPLANPARLAAKRDRLLHRLFDAGAIDAQTLALAKLEPVPLASQPVPVLAPHLAQTLKARLAPQQPVIRTTLHKSVQQQTEEIVARHAGHLQRLGIDNAAALVVETASGKVRAYTGSQDFWDTARQGQVDGVVAPRSSGSILKPFLYALAIDDGLLLPPTLLRDVPTSFGAFAPQNADEKYSGFVAARQALVQSLNVPAVRLLNSYGIRDFQRFLQAAGVTTLFRDADDYGLPLIIGGAEVTLWEMAQLYRSLARGGRLSPLSVLPGNSATSGAALLSPGACYLTLEMLRDVHRPGAEFYWEQYDNQWPLAWKTGTSYGQRDAWAIGVSPQWTVAVWAGNFDGEGNGNLAGAGIAGPLLFDLFNALPRQAAARWFVQPAGELIELPVCAETGLAPAPECPRRHTPAPRHMKPLRRCGYHTTIYLSLDGQYQVCSRCWTPGAYTATPQLVNPPEIAQYLRQRGQTLATLPPHRPECPMVVAGSALQILYPAENARLWLPRDFGSIRQQVMLRAAHRDHQRTLFWYLDDRYLGATVNEHVQAADVGRGWHVLEIVDEAGQRDRRRFFVEGD